MLVTIINIEKESLNVRLIRGMRGIERKVTWRVWKEEREWGKK